MGLEGFFVEHLDSRQTVLEVFRVIFFLPETYCCVFADVFKAFEAAVDADGAELFVDVDKSCGVGGEHTTVNHLQVVRTVSQEVLLDSLDDCFKGEFLLPESVEVDGDYLYAACGDAASSEGVTECVVSKLVAEATAGCEAVGRGTFVVKEAVAFGHLGCQEVKEVFIFGCVFFYQIGGYDDRECEQFFAAFFTKPFHEELLELLEGDIVGLGAVWEVEFVEQGDKIVFVED